MQLKIIKSLRVKILENALANKQIDKVEFEMLPALAANAGYSGSGYYKSTTSATVPNSDLAGSIGSSYSTSSKQRLIKPRYWFYMECS